MTAFASAIALTRREVFDALEACAEAERVLLRCGRPVEAAGVAAVFELLEDRLVLDPLPGRPSSPAPPGGLARPASPAGPAGGYLGPAAAAGPAAADSPGGAPAGSNASDREFTQ